jgi:hypothetical protein
MAGVLDVMRRSHNHHAVAERHPLADGDLIRSLKQAIMIQKCPRSNGCRSVTDDPQT